MCYKYFAVLTCTFQHDRAPPDGPAPTDKTEEDTKQLRHGNDYVDYERTETRLRAVVLRKAWDSNAKAKNARE